MKKKVLVFTSSFPRWDGDSSGHFVRNLSERLGDRFDVTVLAPHFPGSRKKQVFSNITVYRYRYFPFEKAEILAGENGILPSLKMNRFLILLVPFFLVAGFFHLLLAARKNKPDIIHAHWLFPQGAQAALVKKLTGVPYIVTVHGSDVFGLSTGIWKWINKFTVDNAKRVIVVSNALAQRVVEQYDPTREPLVCPMGVDAKLFWSNHLEKKKPENLLFVGRLSEVKGVAYLLQAMPAIIKENPGVQLTIVGGGELEPALRKLADQLDITNYVHFTGKMENAQVAERYRNAGIFIGPSIEAEGGDTEGFGLTFVEAAFSGCLIIATDVGGISDIVRNKKTGIVIPQKNRRSIEEAVNTAIASWQEHMPLLYRAKAYCYERYDWEIIGRNYIEQFEKSFETGHMQMR